MNSIRFRSVTVGNQVSLDPKCKSAVSVRLGISELSEKLKEKKKKKDEEEERKTPAIEILIQQMWDEIQKSVLLKSSQGLLIHSYTAEYGWY